MIDGAVRVVADRSEVLDERYLADVVAFWNELRWAEVRRNWVDMRDLDRRDSIDDRELQT